MSFTSSSGCSATGRPHVHHPIPGARAQIWISPKHSTYAGFTNTSRHPVSYKNRVHETAENLYHAFKFIGYNDKVAEVLAKAPDPKKVADAFQEYMNPAWQTTYISVLDQVLTIKFNTYSRLKEDLLATGDAELILLGSDQYWCRSEDGNGQNEFGKALMRVRALLRQ